MIEGKLVYVVERDDWGDMWVMIPLGRPWIIGRYALKQWQMLGAVDDRNIFWLHVDLSRAAQIGRMRVWPDRHWTVRDILATALLAERPEGHPQRLCYSASVQERYVTKRSIENLLDSQIWNLDKAVKRFAWSVKRAKIRGETLTGEAADRALEGAGVRLRCKAPIGG